MCRGSLLNTCLLVNNSTRLCRLQLCSRVKSFLCHFNGIELFIWSVINIVYNCGMKYGMMHLNIYQLIENMAKRMRTSAVFSRCVSAHLVSKRCISFFFFFDYENRIRVAFFQLLGEKKEIARRSKS